MGEPVLLLPDLQPTLQRKAFSSTQAGAPRYFHDQDASAEAPLFINPEEDDPSRYLGFREEYVFLIRNNRRARETIDSLGLNRVELAEQRAKRLRSFKKLLDCQLLLSQQIELAEAAGVAPDSKSREHVENLDETLLGDTSVDAEYAAMMRAALTDFQ